MEEIDKIVGKFIDGLDKRWRDRILTVVVYGSRVLKRGRDDSDLDILLCIEGMNSYRIGKIIDGIRCDVTAYGINSLFDVLDSKNKSNNTYFKSVFRYGYVYEDKIGLEDIINNYMFSCENRKMGRKLSSRMVMELLDLYEEFLKDGNEYSYYNLLEMIRTCYHYKGGFSYVSLVKVSKIYRSVEYENNYQLRLPGVKFRELFLEALEKKGEERRVIVDELFKVLEIDRKQRYSEAIYEQRYCSRDDVKYSLLVFYNRLGELERVLDKRGEFLYIFNVSLKQVYELGCQIEMDEELKEYYDEVVKEESIKGKYRWLCKILAVMGANYRFDYDDYMVKLKR